MRNLRLTRTHQEKLCALSSGRDQASEESNAPDSSLEMLTEEFNKHYAMCGICQQPEGLCYEGARLLRKFNHELVKRME